MPKNLKRRYGTTKLHFITFSCYRRLPFLRTVRARNAFLVGLNEVRAPVECHRLCGSAVNCGTPHRIGERWATRQHEGTSTRSSQAMRARRVVASAQAGLPVLLKGETAEKNDVAQEASIDDCAAFWSWRRLKPTLLSYLVRVSVPSFISVQWAPASSVNFVFQVTMPGLEKSLMVLMWIFLPFCSSSVS